MSPEQIQQKIKAVLPDAEIILSGEDCNFGVEVRSVSFKGKSPIQCHRLVNGIFKDELESGALHALSIKTKAL